MENKGLLFIPDISGFTRFVNESEIEHSRFIIQELLEVLINANETGLEISEIEGDAILFYKFGSPLELQKLYGQVEKMFTAFHRHLYAYEHRRLCQCSACVSAIDLTLKVISHYGEFTSYNVKNFSKLIGRDIIVAHQLLKNDIDQHEYWLVTESLLQDEPPAGLTQWMRWNASAKQTETGEIPFHYTQLSALKDNIRDELSPGLEPADKVKMVSVSREYNVDIKSLYFTVVHFEFRHRWQEGVKLVDEVNHLLPGVGTRHRVITEHGQEFIYTSSFSYDPDTRIVFGETDEEKRHITHYILDKIDDHTSRLTLEHYIAKDPIRQLLFRMTKQAKMEAAFYHSLQKLEILLPEIEVPEF